VTREQFIEQYMERAELSVAYRRSDGYQIGSHRRVAVPCACGEDICTGWAMIPADDVDNYVIHYGPTS
jgi:hypothetical protein